MIWIVAFCVLVVWSLLTIEWKPSSQKLMDANTAGLVGCWLFWLLMGVREIYLSTPK